MKLTPISLVMMAALMATSCANEELVDANPDVQGNAIQFRPLVGHSRAIETTVNNLGDFAVVAKGIHPHGGVYSNYLIGNANGGDRAIWKEGSIWNLESNVYWPTSTPSAIFWAYTTSQRAGDNKTPILPEGVSFGFDENGTTPTISGFKPSKADISQASDNGYWNDGTNQSDLLVAFTQQDRSTDASNVSLNFEHALSQIDIQAASNRKLSSDNRIVRIKGAWIVNAKNKADLSAGFTFDEDTQKADAKTEWGALNRDGFSAYGSFYTTPIILDNATETRKLLGTSLMIIPQTLTEWNKKAGEADNNGAYILLLCRVELKHKGDQHSGDDIVNDDVYIDTKNHMHYHQQFPVNAHDKFDAAEYGFVCVPVNSTWERGKKYQYTLDICGATTGAGIYPPDLADTNFSTLIPDGNKFDFFGEEYTLKIVGRDEKKTGKKVGDAVLSKPIQFSVDVKQWDANSGWTSGDINLQ